MNRFDSNLVTRWIYIFLSSSSPARSSTQVIKAPPKPSLQISGLYCRLSAVHTAVPLAVHS